MFDPDDLDDETAAYHEAGHALNKQKGRKSNSPRKNADGM